MEVTHILVSDVVSQAAALRLGFAYHFGARGRSVFYHMEIGTPIYEVWGGPRDTWWSLPLVRLGVGCAL
jgi:hypothetical protein